MPKRFERHRRSGEYWDSQPPRSAERAGAAAEPAVKVPGRKDRWARCKANGGGPHVLAITVTEGPHPHGGGCRWIPDYSPRDRVFRARWRCIHHEACIHCGKESRYRIGRDECPGYPGSPGQRDEAELDAERATRHRDAWYARRKAAPAGQQGYRRKRGAA